MNGSTRALRPCGKAGGMERNEQQLMSSWLAMVTLG